MSCKKTPYNYYKNYFIPKRKKKKKQSVSYMHKNQSQGKIFLELFQSQHHKKIFLEREDDIERPGNSQR